MRNNTTTMGKVFTTLTIINRADQIRAKDGAIPALRVRSVTLKKFFEIMRNEFIPHNSKIF